MSKRITIIQGHPTPRERHFCHALADAYATGATGAGHEIRRVEIAELDFPLLRSKQEWDIAASAPVIEEAQEAIGWADHLVILYPLWLGTMPALLKGFLEQIFRPGFGVGKDEGGVWKAPLRGKSARIIVTMGMPALLYRWYFGAHSLKSLERNILAFVGITPNRHTLIGMVERIGDAKRRAWLETVGKLGSRAL